MSKCVITAKHTENMKKIMNSCYE